MIRIVVAIDVMIHVQLEPAAGISFILRLEAGASGLALFSGPGKE